jgi:hypothetical protein
MCFSLWYLCYHPVDSHHHHRPTADVSHLIAVPPEPELPDPDNINRISLPVLPASCTAVSQNPLQVYKACYGHDWTRLSNIVTRVRPRGDHPIGHMRKEACVRRINFSGLGILQSEVETAMVSETSAVQSIFIPNYCQKTESSLKYKFKVTTKGTSVWGFRFLRRSTFTVGSSD